jgi:hypothetical protein
MGGFAMIYVCDKCLMASCWAGKFMCDDSRTAGLYRARRVDLVRLGREHTDYMDDKDVQAPLSDKNTPMLPRRVLREWMEASR